MEFLHSNFPPVRPGGRSFTDAFYDMLPGTDSLDIAVGYITSDSLIELERLTELNNLRNVNLTIGMHYRDVEELLKPQEEKIEHLKQPDCEHAEHDGAGCLGYCGCTQDDEPIESCKRCEKYTGNVSEGWIWDE